MITDAIRQVVDRKDLDAQVAHRVMLEMISGATTPSQIGSFVTAMRMKGETEQELKGFALAMRESCVKICAPAGAVDLCGTGGDGSGTLNISTAASFVVAAASVPVAKHGNRSVSSRSGSADMLGALGIPYDLDPSSVERCLHSTGIGFMFAPTFHASMKNVLAPRREIGIRTVFNILGPLANPACVKNQLVGVYEPRLVPVIARVLKGLGSENVMVVHGSGLDEITVAGATHIAELRGGVVSEYDIVPSDLGIDEAERASLTGGSPEENARAALAILGGEESSRADAVAVNAAAGIYIAGRADNLTEALEKAREVIRTGKAKDKLREFAESVRMLEGGRQATQPAEMLLRRRIMPEVLIARCGEIASRLSEDIEALPGGHEALSALDPEITERPSVLSVLVLNRMAKVLGGSAHAVRESHRSSFGFFDMLRSPGVSIIGEYKPMSPSSGPLRVPPPLVEVAQAYARSRMDGVSVLVEPDFFGGGPEMFSQVRSRVVVPMLFKDFVVSKEQVALAEALGADAVLLIAKALTPEALDRLAIECLQKDVEPMVEVHDEDDIVKLRSCGSFSSLRVFGINSRDLRTMAIRPERRLLREKLPKDVAVVAESGIRSPSELQSLRNFDAVLVGSALMDAHDVYEAASEFVAAGRRAGA